MSWEKQVSVNDIELSLDSGGFGGYDTRVCFSIDDFLEMETDDFESIKAWVAENAEEIAVIEFAKECHWSMNFLKVDQLLLILQGKVATEEERNQAKLVLENAMQGKRYSSASNDKPKLSRPKIAGYIYLLSADNGLYKIGKAKRLDERVTQLSVKLPVKITLLHSIESDDYTWAEMHLHGLFAEKREHGEWFKLEIDDIEKIKGMQRLDTPA